MSTTANKIFFFIFIALAILNLTTGILFFGPFSFLNFACVILMGYYAREHWKEWHA